MKLYWSGATHLSAVFSFDSSVCPISFTCRWPFYLPLCCRLQTHIFTAWPGEIKLIKSSLHLLSLYLPSVSSTFIEFDHIKRGCKHPFLSCFLTSLLLLMIVVFASAGRVVVRPKSAVRCMEWSARISGAPPVAGKKPASASPTKDCCVMKSESMRDEDVNEWMNDKKRLLSKRGYNPGPESL